MDRKEAIQVLQTALTAPFVYGAYANAIEMAIESLSVELSGDVISRAAAIKAVANAIWHYPNECYKNLNVYDMAEALAKDAIMPLPSVNVPTKCIAQININADEIVKKIKDEYEIADRPSGEWIIRENGNNECSLCGRERQDGWDYFCGYCGADMRGGVK